MRESSVWRGMPSLTAAPDGPEMRPRESLQQSRVRDRQAAYSAAPWALRYALRRAAATTPPHETPRPAKKSPHAQSRSAVREYCRATGTTAAYPSLPDRCCETRGQPSAHGAPSGAPPAEECRPCARAKKAAEWETHSDDKTYPAERLPAPPPHSSRGQNAHIHATG